MKKLYFVSILIGFLFTHSASAQIITTYAGNGIGTHPDSALYGVQMIAADSAGNIYNCDYSRIIKISTSATQSIVAGDGDCGYSGDGGPATQAEFGGVNWLHVALDRSGTIMYLCDALNDCIRKVDASGIVTTIAGTGVYGFSGDGGPATLAELNGPRGIAVDDSGNLFIADYLNYCIRKINTAGIISTIAGNGTLGYSGDGGLATAAQIIPFGIAVDASDNIYFSDYGAAIRKVTNTGYIYTVAGGTVAGFSGDSGPATLAQLNTPVGIALNPAGNLLYVADNSNERVRIVNLSTGIINTFAGNGDMAYAGDGGTATKASLLVPISVATDKLGNVYIGEQGNIRKVDGGGTISTVANGINPPARLSDGGPAAAAQFFMANGVTADHKGNIYVAEGGEYYKPHNIRKINSNGIITTVAGRDSPGYSGDGGPATMALLKDPVGVVFDTLGNMYIADQGNHAIRKVDTAGKITTIAGNGATFGDGGPAVDALIVAYGIAIDKFQNIYIPDGISRVRKIDPSGIITTFAGNGTTGYTGDGSLASSATLNIPVSVVADDSGNIYIADQGNSCIRVVNPSGVINTYISGFIPTPGALTIDKENNLYVSDCSNSQIFKIDAYPNVIPYVGNGAFDDYYSGDGGPATAAGILANPYPYTLGMTTDDSDNLYLCQNEFISTNNLPVSTIRKVSATTPASATLVKQLSAPLQNITLFPNPNNGDFTLTGALPPLANEADITIINAIGQVVYQSSVKTVNTTLNAPIQLNKNLSSGLYLLNIKSGANSKTIPFTLSR